MNPAITEPSTEKIAVSDACLGFLSVFTQVERHREITMGIRIEQGVAQNSCRKGAKSFGTVAEIDHVDGILAVDRITDGKTMCTREEFERRYRAASPYAIESAK